MLNAPGTRAMIFFKNLMLSRSYFERVPSQEIIAGDAGERYDHIVATRGRDYAFANTFTGRVINIDTDKLGWSEFKASWYSPRNFSIGGIGDYVTGGTRQFDPSGEPAPGIDRVLILDRLR